jgi:pSer/pThr/pTyr-binding forkhead associated (FHA) protein
MGKLMCSRLGSALGGRLDTGVSIGRTSENTISFSIRCVSRRHAVLLYRRRQLVVVDLGSKNGTYVDGQKLTPWQMTKIGPGASLSFGGGHD